jgi:inhibitor of cysteine peptidase
MAEHQLSESDNGTVLEAQVGDVIELRLNETSGGYRWLLDSPADHALESLGEEFEFAESVVGARNEARFRFRVRSGGNHPIRLHYRRTWEKNEPPLKTYEVAIRAS